MVTSADPFDLARFIKAQNPIIDRVMNELRAGQKRSHWMWFVFPQLRGLGSSATAYEFGISCLDEARAYLEHSPLGGRLRDCTRAVIAIEGRSLNSIFGSPDDLKFRSSMTLFREAADDPTLFDQALKKYCGGEPDAETLQLLKKARLSTGATVRIQSSDA